MRKPRILGRRETNYYHVMSRVVNRDYILGDEEKEFFRRTMRKLEAFMGVRVLTYCIMSNHWHILLEIPTSTEIDDDELHRRICTFYPKQRAKVILQEYERALAYSNQTGNTKWIDEWREKYTSRMGDLSAFVKELKERFSKWYNRKHSRRGTLWEERFKSVLVEDSDHTIATMATYIELNPVRAGLVDDPRDYRFCGYAEAVAGGTAARSGIKAILFLHGQQASWRAIVAQYRTHLFSMGEANNERQGFEAEEVQKVIDSGGELNRYELMRCRIRYFNDGVALGSRLFVEEVFEQNRHFFSERRKTGARKMQGNGQDGLYSLRNLRLNPISAPG